MLAMSGEPSNSYATKDLTHQLVDLLDCYKKIDDSVPHTWTDGGERRRNPQATTTSRKRNSEKLKNTNGWERWVPTVVPSGDQSTGPGETRAPFQKAGLVNEFLSNERNWFSISERDMIEVSYCGNWVFETCLIRVSSMNSVFLYVSWLFQRRKMLFEFKFIHSVHHTESITRKKTKSVFFF